MKYDRSQSVSFKSFDDGPYVGVLVGYAYVGLHETKEWGSKPKCMLRWEVHAYNAPHTLVTDDEGQSHVVTQTFPATIQGDSWLYKCLVAHGVIVPGGGCTDSKSWYGKVALLTIEGSPSSRSDRVFMNVTEIKPLTFDVNISPTFNYEHWEPEDEASPPIWAKFMIERSSDLYQRASLSKPVPTRPNPNQGPDRPSAPSSEYRPPAQAGYQAPYDTSTDDDDDIPFHHRDSDVII